MCGQVFETRPENLLELQIGGLEIGRASLYNFCLNRKKAFEREFDAEEWRDFGLHLKSCLVSYFAGRNLLDQLKPDYLFFYSSSYSINLVVLLQALQKNIKCFSIAAGTNWANRLQRMHVAATDNFHALTVRRDLWISKYRNLPATMEGLHSALLFKTSLLAGTNAMVYGGGNRRLPRQLIMSEWGIPADSKVLFMATSSSDELLAAQTIKALPVNPRMAFTTQIEWIEETIKFVKNRKDLFLIIRVHPREFPNRREPIGSEHSLRLRQMLQNLPQNVRVNWPDDRMSLYDWIEVIDLGLTSWSSAGKEFAMWGIPNLSYTEEIAFYPKRELGFIGETREGYFHQIDVALKAGWSEERIYKTYRWVAYDLEAPVFDLSDAIPDSLAVRKSPFWRIFDKLTRYRFVERKWLLYHRQPLKQSALIAKRVTTGIPTEDVLEEVRVRLSTTNEIEESKKIVREIAELRFGPNWELEVSASPLRARLAGMLG